MEYIVMLGWGERYGTGGSSGGAEREQGDEGGDKEKDS